MLPNIPDFPLVALGILEAGGIISTVNPLYTARKFFYIKSYIRIYINYRQFKVISFYHYVFYLTHIIQTMNECCYLIVLNCL